MKVLSVPATITGAELGNNAIAIALGQIEVNGAEQVVIGTSKMSGNETFTVLSKNSKPETTIKDFRNPIPTMHSLVIGLAPQSVVENEFTDWVIIDAVTETGTPANVLFKGYLKQSKSETYDPAFLAYQNVIFKGTF